MIEYRKNSSKILVNKLKPYYFKELAEYDEVDVLEKLENNQIVLEKLSSHPNVNFKNGKYKFQYVGIIVIDDVVINCYPKYIPNENNIENDFKEIINVIKKYDKSKYKFGYENLEFADNSFNRLSLMLFFMEDYFENGLYTNYQSILEINGNGEIDWSRTINDTVAIIQNNNPYYTDLLTKHNMADTFDYFRLLHEYIITDCSEFFEKHDLLDLFDLTPVKLSDKSLENFGEKEFILNKIYKQLNIEFNTHKRKLLKFMYNYFVEKSVFSDDEFLSEYGVSKYEHIWEEMCAFVFDNRLDDKVGKTLSDLFDEEYSSNIKFKDIVKRPVWILNGDSFEEDKFRLDLLTFDKNENGVDFIIMDAKYYILNFKDGQLKGQPGLESITKQYLYQLAFKEFIDKIKKFNCIKNAFLLPKYGYNQIRNEGYVTLKILNDLGLEDIQVMMIPANKLNKLYLSESLSDMFEFKLELLAKLKEKNKSKKDFIDNHTNKIGF